MIARRSSEFSAPIAWVGRIPVYTVTIIVALHVVGMITAVLMKAFGSMDPASLFGFNTTSVFHDFQFYRCLTYAFIHNPDPWFILEMVMFYIFGRDVEIFLGRGGFVRLYAGLVLIAPTLLLTISAATGQSLHLLGGWANFAVFIAFASLYPNAQILFQITAKMIAWIFLGIAFLQLLAARQTTDMAALFATVSLAWFAIRRGATVAPRFLAKLNPAALLRRRSRPRLRIVKPKESPDPEVLIDSLLEKISRSGISSLSSRERRQLEQARTALLQKDGARRS